MKTRRKPTAFDTSPTRSGCVVEITDCVPRFRQHGRVFQPVTLVRRVRRLAGSPRPPGVKKLAGREAWRIRVGDYRVIYEIHDRILQVIVVTVGHRREVYR